MLLQYASVVRQTGNKVEAACAEKEARETRTISQAGLVGQTVNAEDLARKR